MSVKNNEVSLFDLSISNEIEEKHLNVDFSHLGIENIEVRVLNTNDLSDFSQLQEMFTQFENNVGKKENTSVLIWVRQSLILKVYL